MPAPAPGRRFPQDIALTLRTLTFAAERICRFNQREQLVCSDVTRASGRQGSLAWMIASTVAGVSMQWHARAHARAAATAILPCGWDAPPEN